MSGQGVCNWFLPCYEIHRERERERECVCVCPNIN